MVAKVLPAYPPPPTDTGGGGCGQKVKINIFRTWSWGVLNLRESHIQKLGSKYFANRAKGSKGQNSTFIGTWSCCILNLREQQMQQHTSKYFANRPLFPHTIAQPNPVNGVKILSEHGHVAYQIKGNHKCSNIVEHILPADPYPL